MQCSPHIRQSNTHIAPPPPQLQNPDAGSSRYGSVIYPRYTPRRGAAQWRQVWFLISLFYVRSICLGYLSTALSSHSLHVAPELGSRNQTGTIWVNIEVNYVMETTCDLPTKYNCHTRELERGTTQTSKIPTICSGCFL